jgi:prepilin-type N-terminal cleavage/methylation domain-containing protein
MKKRQSGYSLVEVLVAIAITSVVLLTVVTLFYMGRRNVYSGKQTTAAVAVGTRIMEDLAVMTAPDILSAFNIDDNTARGTVTLSNVAGAPKEELQYTDSLGLDTSTCTVTAGTKTSTIACTQDDTDSLYFAKWYKMVIPGNDKDEVLASPAIGLVLTPRDPSDADKPWTTARFLRVRAYISWEQSARLRRYAFFDTTKVNR